MDASVVEGDILVVRGAAPFLADLPELASRPQHEGFWKPCSVIGESEAINTTADHYQSTFRSSDSMVLIGSTQSRHLPPELALLPRT